MAATVLVIGSGGREHALSWKLAHSDQVGKVMVSPGNAGTNNCGKISNVVLDLKDFTGVATWCKENKIDLVVVGPEDPLANGISDALGAAGVSCFGPSAKAAQIEASKEFAKSFMDSHEIPTARWKAFTDAQAAQDFINNADFPALVVKASGLAAGKGVIVAKDKAEACQAVIDILKENKFGAAGNTVVIEELLEGEEVSVLAFTDGISVASLPPAQDHKRALDGDRGLNTGGMGAYCPCPLVSKEDVDIIQKEVLQKAVDGMKAKGHPYVGVLYAGLMLTKDGPKVLEYNCRFGDPETQVVLPLLKSDLYLVMKKCVDGDLASMSLECLTDKTAVAVVMVSEGYPGSYKKGFEITKLSEAKEKLSVTIFHAGTALNDDKVVTSGGRVLSTVAIDADLTTAAEHATEGAKIIEFKGKFFRKDIAHKALKRKSSGLSYKDSGVDIAAGDNLVSSIKPMAKATNRAGCVSEIGSFGGIFDVKAAGYKDPLLVSGTDGVGTKLKIAQECEIHNTVGIDLVAMCVNDILAHGAEPLFFLDYFACGHLEVSVAKAVLEGIAEGCKQAGCALLGGETAEMPGMYSGGDYDLAGFAVGAVERDQLLPRTADIKDDDVIIGLPSSGIHSNGFSLVRKIVDHCGLDMKSSCPFDEKKILGEALLCPTRIYVKSVLPAMHAGKVKAFAHITGGGLPDNIVRILPDGLGAQLDASKWEVHPVFGWIAAKGNVEVAEMERTFNCGLGGVLVVSSADSDQVVDLIKANGQEASVVGKISQVDKDKGHSVVEIQKLEKSLEKAFSTRWKHRADEALTRDADKKARVNGDMSSERKKVGVLISGSGTNLQALIDHTHNPDNQSTAEIVLVISNKPDVQGLKRAEDAGIPTKVIKHKDYEGRAEFDEALHTALTEAGVEYVCLAGFMRILTGEFVRKWEGRMLNVHPSLLPAFKGANAHKLVIEAEVRISGCSVHFVAEEVDAGAILVQESVPVFPGDTEESLAERVKSVEHKAFPRALDLVTSEAARLVDGKIKWMLKT